MIAHADFIFDIGLPVSLRRDEDDKKPSTANDVNQTNTNEQQCNSLLVGCCAHG